ncbi:MAG TPA: hypothetical protein VHF22_13495, partial [Planctomycetota bacterium]|nr:hypothetical protein [Planctomycetota bacterium]
AIARDLSALGRIALALGEDEVARDALERAARVRLRLGDPSGAQDEIARVLRAGAAKGDKDLTVRAAMSLADLKEEPQKPAKEAKGRR